MNDYSHLMPPDEDPVTQGFRDHWNVFIEAHKIHVERTKVRGDLWRVDGIVKMAMVAEDKARRIRYALENGLDPELDDAYDLVNYAAFVARLIKERDA